MLLCMARPKAFDRDVALRRAMQVFWQQGYEATSTEDLVCGMGIGRQSMYDTFGDKHSIYLEALKLYRDEQGSQLHALLRDAESPRGAIEALFRSLCSEPPSARSQGCMLVNATTECAAADADVLGLVDENRARCEKVFEQTVRRAQSQGEVPPGLDARAAGRFLMSTLQGLRVSAKAGASPAALRDIVRLALAALSPSHDALLASKDWLPANVPPSQSTKGAKL